MEEWKKSDIPKFDIIAESKEELREQIQKHKEKLESKKK